MLILCVAKCNNATLWERLCCIVQPVRSKCGEYSELKWSLTTSPTTLGIWRIRNAICPYFVKRLRLKYCLSGSKTPMTFFAAVLFPSKMTSSEVSGSLFGFSR